MRDDCERLRDMLEAIAKIEKYARRGREVCQEDELIQTWILYHLQILGEASAAMSEATRARHPDVPWQDMSDFRNVLVHEYFRIDVDIIWAIVQGQLPTLKNQIETIFLPDNLRG